MSSLGGWVCMCVCVRACETLRAFRVCVCIHLCHSVFDLVFTYFGGLKKHESPGTQLLRGRICSPQGPCSEALFGALFKAHLDEMLSRRTQTGQDRFD